MKTPLGTEVDIGAGHIVLNGFPALRERGTAPPSLVYCGHGRPSQLLLSSCSIKVQTGHRLMFFALVSYRSVTDETRAKNVTVCPVIKKCELIVPAITETPTFCAAIWRPLLAQCAKILIREISVQPIACLIWIC